MQETQARPPKSMVRHNTHLLPNLSIAYHVITYDGISTSPPEIRQRYVYTVYSICGYIYICKGITVGLEAQSRLSRLKKTYAFAYVSKLCMQICIFA